MPVCPDVSPVLFVHEVGLHLGHCQVHFLPINQSHAGPEAGHLGVMNSVHEIFLGNQRGQSSFLPALPQRVGKNETAALEFLVELGDVLVLVSDCTCRKRVKQTHW